MWELKKTLRWKVGKYLQSHGPSSINEICGALEQQRPAVVNKLNVLKRYAHANDKMVKRATAYGHWICVHEWRLTPKGSEWLRLEETQ